MRTSTIAALLAICLGGCATVAPVTQQTQQNYDGFSIVPPQVPGWVVVASNDRQVRLQKKSASDTHKMYLGVSRRLAPKAFTSREEFLQHVNDSYFTVDPHFFEILTKETSLNPKHGEFCVEYRYKYKDYKSPRPKGASFMLHEGHCFLCLHPDARDREYNVCHSETFAPGEEDSQYRVMGDAFIDSIQFTEIDKSKQGVRDLLSISAELLDSKNRVFVLHQFGDAPFTRFEAKIDGVPAGKLSSHEVATAKLKPGQHTIKASYGLMRGEKSFNLIQDKAVYFVCRERGKLLSHIEILEVPEPDWIHIAADPLRRGR